MAREIVITVSTGPESLPQEHRLSGLPLTLGRDDSCDIVISSHFVSGRHAQLEEDKNELHIRDLGSTNGTHIEGADGTRTRLASQSKYRLSECNNRFFLGGRLEVVVQPSSQVAALGDLPGLTQLPDPQAFGHPSRSEGPVNLPSLPGISRSPGVAPALGTPPSFANASLNLGPPGSPSLNSLPALGSGAVSLPPLPGAKAPVPFASRPGSPSPTAPPPADARLNPHLATGSFELTKEQLALQGLRELASSLNPGHQLDSQGDVARLITRLHDIVEMVSSAYVTLRQGYEQFSEGTNLPVEAPGPTLDPSQGSPHVAAALIRTSNQAFSAVQETENGFRQIAIHQVALFDGLERGVRALLNELAPERVEHESQPARKAFGLSNTHKSQWDEYTRRHKNLSSPEQGLRRLFGAEFASAYRKYYQSRQ